MTSRRIAGAVVAIAATATLAFTISAAADDEGRATEATTATVDTPSPSAHERTQVARIVAAYVAPDELVIEPAELLVGDAAAAAAAAAGDEVLDFYVREHPGARTTLPVSPDVTVTVVECTAACKEGAPGDYGALTTTVDGTSLHRLTIVDGAVVHIDEVYLP